MKSVQDKEYHFGWFEIILSAAAKTMINLNYKFHFTYTPFLMEDFGLSLQQWGVILTAPEWMMVAVSALTVFLNRYPPNKVNSFFMCFTVLPNILQPLGIYFFPTMSVFY